MVAASGGSCPPTSEFVAASGVLTLRKRYAARMGSSVAGLVASESAMARKYEMSSAM